MSFLPGNDSDKQRKQREYKEALDAQVQGKRAHNTAAGAGGAALPLINPRGQAHPNPQPLLRQQYQFPSGSDSSYSINLFRFHTSNSLNLDADRYGAPPAPRPAGQYAPQMEADLRSLMNQVDRLSYAQSSSDEMMRNIQSEWKRCFVVYYLLILSLLAFPSSMTQ